MENNWNTKAKQLATNWLDWIEMDSSEFNNCVGAIEEAMNLVFEATKKECADKAELIDNGYSDEAPDGDMYYFERLTLDEDSILNINKPNL